MKYMRVIRSSSFTFYLQEYPERADNRIGVSRAHYRVTQPPATIMPAGNKRNGMAGPPAVAPFVLGVAGH